eukprot:8642761-Pyramimonas_sp.AAC.1
MATGTTPTWPPASNSGDPAAQGLKFPRPPRWGTPSNNPIGPLMGGTAGPHLLWLANHTARVSPTAPSSCGDDRAAYPP